MFKEIEDIKSDDFFILQNDGGTRGRNYKTKILHTRLDIRKYSFSQRIINEWNSLSFDAVNTSSVIVLRIMWACI